ncbi:hypothetical protein LTR08_003113 [Meristemomyces frigidus]|nr:hypothetical protein LTR08_003113 [Meristemomyces frigidus]
MSQPLYPSFTPTYHHDQYPAIDPTNPRLDCSDKFILITGGGRGIGKAIAFAFAKAHAKGIMLIGRTHASLAVAATELKQMSPATEVFIRTADIMNQDEVQQAMDATIAHFGVVPDVVVNNAGGLGCIGSLTEVDLVDFYQAFELNVKGPLNVLQAFLRANRTHSPDAARTVINLSSGAAHVPFYPGGAAYATSKLANTKIVEYLHHENPTWNVFNMQPGVVATDLAKQAGRSNAPDAPELPAGFAVWLATQPEAREVFNGKFLWANWDVNELLERKELVERGLLTLTLKGWAEDTSTEDMKRRAASVSRDADRKE